MLQHHNTQQSQVSNLDPKSHVKFNVAHSGAYGMLGFWFFTSFPPVCLSHSLGRQSTAVQTDVASEIGRWGLLSFTRSPPRDLQKFIFLTKTSCTPTPLSQGVASAGLLRIILVGHPAGGGVMNISPSCSMSFRGSCCPEHGRWSHKLCSDLLPVGTLFPWFLLARSPMQNSSLLFGKRERSPFGGGSCCVGGFLGFVGNFLP